MSRFAMTPSRAQSFLSQAPDVTVAAVVEGRPLLRRMHPAFVDGTIVLHGSPEGEKAAWVGAPVVVAADQVVARIPSHWRHPERACPATTWFRSVHVTGHLEALTDLQLRAQALQAMMERLQPEGGYRPITAEDPLYAKVVAGLGMWRVVPRTTVGVDKLGQHLARPAMNRVLEGLWTRGGPGDLAAIEVIRKAHADDVRFVELPEGWRARCSPDEADVAATVALIRDAYWNPGFSDATLAAAVRGGAWVGIEVDDQLVAVARGVSDGHKRGHVQDVVVHPGHRGRGLGKAVVKLVLDHPQLREVDVLHGGTRDATELYTRFGFVPKLTHGEGANRRTLLIRDRRPVRA